MIILKIFMKMLRVLLWVLLIIVLAIFIIPFRYKMRVVSQEEKSISVDIHWLFGLLGIRGIYRYASGFEGTIHILGIRQKINEKKLAKHGNGKRKGKKEKDKKGERNRVFSVEAFKYLLSIIRNVLCHVLPRRIEGYGLVGFGDPYYTGLLSALLESLRGIGYHNMDIRYAFDREVYQGEIYVEGRLIIIYLVYIALRLLLHKSSRNMLLGTRRKSYGT